MMFFKLYSPNSLSLFKGYKVLRIGPAVVFIDHENIAVPRRSLDAIVAIDFTVREKGRHLDVSVWIHLFKAPDDHARAENLMHTLYFCLVLIALRAVFCIHSEVVGATPHSSLRKIHVERGLPRAVNKRWVSISCSMIEIVDLKLIPTVLFNSYDLILEPLPKR